METASISKENKKANRDIRVARKGLIIVNPARPIMETKKNAKARGAGESEKYRMLGSKTRERINKRERLNEYTNE